MNKINLSLDHCFGITKLSQELTFEGENAVLIYAPNGLMKTSFAKALQLYGQGKADKLKDVVADITGSINIKDEHGNVVLPSSIYVSNCEEPDSETPKNITSFLADSVLKQQYDDILKNCLTNRKHCSRISAITQEVLILYLNLCEHSVKVNLAFSIASLRK